MTAIAERPTHAAHTARFTPRAAAVHALSASLTAAGLDPVGVNLEAVATQWHRDHGTYDRLGNLPKERLARIARTHPSGFRETLSPWDVAAILRG
ncbi:hypothetical protein GCM10011374_30410 [Kocuria dechangensis]|uniref:Uncharacterized protein n=1 Tax=Kocuria dechangensis TaxID=1176249 RepID=A0A917H1K8_9MICC|nr:hypothetical protein [Kocuria dechangensis]GGG64648.1 hypothetical protein GCM10011374_30410 [Kocuria dechangensis]